MFKQLLLRSALAICMLLAGQTQAAPALSGAEIVTVNGEDWAQPNLFKSLTWSSVNAQCPAGVCGVGATLNGYDVAGWTWASLEMVDTLFSHFNNAFPTSGAGVSSEVNSTWASAIFSAGFLPTFIDPSGEYIELVGSTSTMTAPGLGRAGFVDNWLDPTGPDSMQTYTSVNIGVAYSFAGVFLVRDASQHIPEPSSLALFGLVLGAMLFVQRRFKHAEDLKERLRFHSNSILQVALSRKLGMQMLTKTAGVAVSIAAFGIANAAPLSLTFEVNVTDCAAQGNASCGSFSSTKFNQTWSIANLVVNPVFVEDYGNGLVLRSSSAYQDATHTDSPFTNSLLSLLAMNVNGQSSTLGMGNQIWYNNGSPIMNLWMGANAQFNSNENEIYAPTENDAFIKLHNFSLNASSYILEAPFTTIDDLSAELIAQYFGTKPAVWTEIAVDQYVNFLGVIQREVFKEVVYSGTATLVAVNDISVIPEPSAMPLMCIGLIGLAYSVRRKRAVRVCVGKC